MTIYRLSDIILAWGCTNRETELKGVNSLTRKIRRYSTTNIYHIIIKGIDSQDIFYDDNDRMVFLEKIIETQRNIEYKIYAYCLMSNHVHLVIEIEDKLLSKAI